MNKMLIARATIKIEAPAAKVWQALIDPEVIKQYLFGSEVITDWQVGSPVIYRGMWQGKPFEDKGRVILVQPQSSLIVTHWSPLSGVPDRADNYHEVRYDVTPEGDGTRLSITQDNNATEDEQQHSSQNWQLVLENLKKLLEK